MTGGQTTLSFGGNNANNQGADIVRPVTTSRKALKIIRASADELSKHEEKLDVIEKKADGVCLWR